MSEYSPEFGADATTPAIDAGLRSLFLLARALQPRLPVLATDLKTLNKILPRLGLSTQQHCGKDGAQQDLARVWNDFFNDSDVEKFPTKALETLQAVRGESLNLSNRGEGCGTDLASAHERAYTLIKSMLEANGLGSMCPEPVSLLVSYDHDAEYYCASTSRIQHRVCWMHQPVPHALYGALIAELIIAHEYLSHVVPLNARLGPSVTETWLVFALTEWFHENEPAQEVAWKNTVWWLMREELRKHLERKNLAKPTPAGHYREEGPFGLHEFAALLYGRSRDDFWRLTGEILKLPSGQRSKRDLLALFGDMTANHTRWLNRLCSDKWNKINDLYRN